MRASFERAAAVEPVARMQEILLQHREESWFVRIEQAVDTLTTSLTAIREELRAQRALLERLLDTNPAAPAPPPEVATTYWLFVPSTAGYALAEHDGGRLAPGDWVETDGRRYRVSVVGRSPLLDGRPCAYLEPRRTPDAAEGEGP